MRRTSLLASVLLTLGAEAQRANKPKMEPVYARGYYVTQRNDTLVGKVKVNPEDELEFYNMFLFKAEGATKGRVVNTQRAKAYGFEGRNFVLTTIDGKKAFYERLVEGRLRFYEHKKKGKENGYDAVVSEYYIRDSQAESLHPELRVSKKVSKKFYKKALKPYMTDQPMIWSDLDKFEFSLNKVLQAVAEFNSYYKNTAN